MRNYILWVFLLLALNSCVEVLNKETPGDAISIDQLSIPGSFNFSTTREFQLQVTTLDNGDEALRNITLEYSYRTDTTDVILGQSVTNSNGVALFSNTFPDHIDTLIIRTDYLGLPYETKIFLPGGSSYVTLGGKTTPDPGASIGGRVASDAGRTEAFQFSYSSAYDNQGVPTKLEPVNDYIPQDLLDLVNASLPERQPVPTFNPQYIASNIITDTRLIDSADVWITFVHEGAGYTNTLGYYTYNLNSPPTSVSQITNFKIIFPNVSLAGSGGNLKPGNKVYLGKFPPDTGIGWFLIPNGWNGTQAVERAEIKYSTKDLNTFTLPEYRQQIVLLKDNTRELLLLGIEDLSRPGGDNDFNDAVFFVTVNPYSAVQNDSNLSTVKTATGTDTDSDGVIDRNDKYPADAAKAFDVFTPGENIYGTLAFEDQWPSKGDYDLNDLVVDYNFQFIANTSNAAVECRATFQVKAIGASYHNGFGIELPIAPSLVESVSITGITDNTIERNANGTESGQERATVILFSDANALFNTSGFINSRTTDQYQKPTPVTIVIKFASPIKMADLGYAPFNPFLIVNGDRQIEVHLPDNTPTSKADRSLLGTKVDSSLPSSGRYYKSGSNLPWAINVATGFEHPVENRPVTEAYLKFASWAQSGGSSYKDWYKNISGYRDGSKVYVKN